MSNINSPTQKERLRELPTPKEANDFLDLRPKWYPRLVRQILTAYVIGDLVQASEAESAYDQGFQDGQRATPAGVEKFWLCREDGREVKLTSWAEGEPHCWYRGISGHYPDCGTYLVVPLDRLEEE